MEEDNVIRALPPLKGGEVKIVCLLHGTHHLLSLLDELREEDVWSTSFNSLLLTTIVFIFL